MGLLRGALAALCCCVLVCLVGIVFGGVIGLFVGTVELVICVVTGRFPLPSVTAIIPLAFFWLLLAVILASYLPRRNPLA